MGNSEKSTEYNYHRLTGLDIARSVAIISMVFVNFMYVLSHSHVAALETDTTWHGDAVLGLLVPLFVLIVINGLAAPTFVTLFGIGLMLQIKRSVSQSGKTKVTPLIKRYLVLIVGGFLFALIWDGDILHYIGLYGIFAVWLTKLNRKSLAGVTAAILVASEILRALFDYNVGWQEGAVGFSYADMWSLRGQFRQIFFNGFHPIFPWLAFVTFGFILAGYELNDKNVQKRMIFGGLFAILLGYLLMILGVPAEFAPPHTLFMLIGMAGATLTIGLSLHMAASKKAPGMLRLLADMGRLSLTHYVAHVIFGIVPVVVVAMSLMSVDNDTELAVPFEITFLISASYVVFAFCLGKLWLKRHQYGPLEWVLRRLAAFSIFKKDS